MIIHYPNIREEKIIPFSKEQIMDKYNIHLGLDPIVTHEDVENSMEDYAKQQALLFCQFRDEYKKEENNLVKKEQERLGGIFSWIPTSDKLIYEEFLNGI